MSHEMFSIDELARHLGRDKREIEKLANRGRIPGRKVNGNWQFQSMEVTRWLEQEMRAYSGAELKNVESSQQSADICSTLPVSAILHRETVRVPLEARTKRSVLEGLIEAAGSTWQIWSPSAVLKAVQEREELMPTAYPGGVALPHPRNPMPDAIGESIMAYGRTMTPIPFGSSSGQQTDLFFMLLCVDSRTHLQILARLGRMLQLPDFTNDLRATDDPDVAYSIICAADEEVSRQL